MAHPKRGDRSWSPEDDDARYESWRYRPARVPSPSYREFRDRATSRGEGQQWSTGRGIGDTEALPHHEIFRDDAHGSDAWIPPEEDTETYIGPMRRYRRTGRRFRAERGPHTGVGPVGYRRSDERIREDVCEFLTQDGLVDASNIEVAVEQGEVTLEGSVDSRAQKRRAEDLCEVVRGVVDVHNRLRLTPSPGG